MRVLVLGGTQFIGRHICEALFAAGHSVTTFTRGKTLDALPAGIERRHGDRDEGARGLRSLADGEWDACVDLSGYVPRQVRPSAEMLQARVRRYVFISAVAVYGDPRDRPVCETHPRVTPAGDEIRAEELDNQTYGMAKVACENIIHALFADRGTVLRPQIVLGPHDPSARYAYWIRRVERGGEMLAPGDGADHVQFIDARDAAKFVLRVFEHDLSGVFNLAGPRMTWIDFLRMLGAGNLVWVPDEALRRAGVTESELPLYRAEHGPRAGLMDVSNERAQAAGLSLTAPAATLRDTREWLSNRVIEMPLSPGREAALLALIRHSAGIIRDAGRPEGRTRGD
ncbi:MAG: NAD-dependent epimerase/dehydratase family protein [Phycisphaerae bacterium]